MTVGAPVRLLAVLVTVAMLLAGTILLLFYSLSDPSTRSETFGFSAWFSASQVVLLLGSICYAAMKDSLPGSVVPVNTGTIVVTAVYNAVAVVTMVLFTQVLLPKHATSAAYYTICAAELLVAATLIVFLRMVSISHQVGHAGAMVGRADVEQLIKTCERIVAAGHVQGWKSDVLPSPERLRFSEGLRRDPLLRAAVAKLLSNLETHLASLPAEKTDGEARRLVVEIENLAARRS